MGGEIMRRWLTGALALVVWASALPALDNPAEDYKALAKEYQDARDAFRKAYDEAKTDEEQQKAFEKLYPDAEKYAERFLALAEKNPKDAVAIDALVWVVQYARPLWPTNIMEDKEQLAKQPFERAKAILVRDHLASDKLGVLALRIGGLRHDRESEKLLRLLLEKSPHREVQGTACYGLARFLKSQAATLRYVRGDAEKAKQLEQFYGKDEAAYLQTLDAAKVEKEMEQLFERAVEKYADVKHSLRDQTMGQLAEAALFELRSLVVGKLAPEIEGEDIDGKGFKLSDYRGKVVLLDFWGHW
jgi:hypothetical protein